MPEELVNRAPVANAGQMRQLVCRKIVYGLMASPPLILMAVSVLISGHQNIALPKDTAMLGVVVLSPPGVTISSFTSGIISRAVSSNIATAIIFSLMYSLH